MTDDTLSTAAFVHDIGKLFIPGVILDKREGFDTLEREIMDLHVDGSDVAYPKELEEEMNVFWEQELYHDMSREDRAAEKEKYESRGENAALEYMLLIEETERSVLRGKAVQPEILNEAQKEAMERMAKKEIKEQTMSKEVAKLLQDQMRDRRMQQEIER